MRDIIQTLKTRIDRELKFIHFCEVNDFSAERAYERLAEIENELYVCRKLNLERINDDLKRRQNI